MLDKNGRLLFTMEQTFQDKSMAYKWEYNTSCPVHVHSDYYEMLFVTEGIYQNVFNGVSEAIPPNTLLIFDVNTVHEFNSTSQADSHFVFASNKEVFNQYLTLHFPGVRLFDRSSMIKCPFSPTQAAYITELARLSGHSTLGKNYIDLFLYNVLAQVQMHITPPNPTGDRYVFDIIEKINNMTYLNTPITEIYKNYPISSTTLIHIFENRIGTGIKKFQIKRKMECAASLLINSDQNITDIAGYVGIDSLSHFISIFKSTYSITPSDYRKKYKQNI